MGAAWRLLAAMVLGVAVTLALAWYAVWCSSASVRRAETAAKVSAYALALQHCLDTTAKYDDYELCAAKADKEFGR